MVSAWCSTTITQFDEGRGQVFTRTTEGMQPTPYGLQLAAAVRDALDLLRIVLERHKAFVAKTSRRAFNVMMSDVSQMLYLLRLLARLSVEAGT